MKTSDNLFQLIRSLTTSEKRYFRLFASRYGGEKSYMRLFDAIDTQDEYDEAAIRKRLGDDESAGRFSVAKNYLSRLILRSLRSYYADASHKYRAREMLADIELLYERGLFDQAHKVLRALQKLLARLDEPYLEFAGLEFREKLSGFGKEGPERLADIHRERMKVLERLKVRSEFEYLVEALGNICKQFPARGSAEYRKLDELMRHPLLARNLPEEATFNDRKLYLWAHATYRYGRNDIPAALSFIRTLVRLYDDHEEMIESQQSHYVALTENLLILLGFHGYVEEYSEQLERLRERFQSDKPAGNKLSRVRITDRYLHVYYSRSLNLHCSLGEFETAAAMSDDVTAYLEEYPNFSGAGPRLYIRSMLAYAWFGFGDYETSLAWVNSVLSEREPLENRSAYYTARLIEILIHYELGNHELVLSRIRSLSTKLASVNLLGPLDREFLCGMERLINCAADSERSEVLLGLKAALQPIGTPTARFALFHHANVLAWIESRLTKVSFSDICRSRSRKRREEM